MNACDWKDAVISGVPWRRSSIPRMIHSPVRVLRWTFLYRDELLSVQFHLGNSTLEISQQCSMTEALCRILHGHHRDHFEQLSLFFSSDRAW
ncbi:hypothetical protein TNCT_345141 [Trichonephila clavata]|uniref:Uncharacterized protein n=1 Tax=Trichonephila clavata TaxID=2740835 RepID=A0A8X6M1A9_TRICU|nr:hypothetical protein TNCT_345141 [Trichonephila clavata]